MTIEQERDKLRAFANEILRIQRRYGDIDGSDVLDYAVEHGLLAGTQATEPCCDACTCAEFGFPTECYRKTDLLKGTK